MSIFSKIFGIKENPIKPPIQAPTADSSSTTPQHPDPSSYEPGFMAIDDVFSIHGRGTVVTGRVDSGAFFVGQPVTVSTATGSIQTTILSIETFRKMHDYATAGQNVGLLLKDVEKNLINRNDTVRGM